MLPLVGICLGFFVVLLDATIVSVALGDIATSVGASLAELQWVVGAYTVPFGALLIGAGAAGDRFGARRVFLAGLGLIAVSGVACALATDLPQLLAARAAQGVGAAMVTPCSLALIAHRYPDARGRARVLGTWGGISGVGLASGPVLGGLLVAGWGWRAVFWAVVPFAVLAAVLTGATVAEAPTRPAGADPLGQLLAVAALAALTGAPIAATTGDTGTAGALAAVAVLAGVAFVLVQRRVRHPLVPPALVAVPRFRTAVGVGALFNFALYGALFCVALVVEQRLGATAAVAGLVLLPLTVVVAGSAALSGRVNARFGPRAAMVAGLGAGAGGSAVLATLGPQPPLWLVAAAGALLGGVGLAMPAMTSVALAAAPPDRAGLGAGVLNAARQAGGALGVATLGAVLLDATGRPALAVPLTVVAAAYGVAVILTVRGLPPAGGRPPRGGGPPAAAPVPPPPPRPAPRSPR